MVMKKCQFCAQDIQEAAIVSRHCGRDVRAPAAIHAPTKPTAPTALAAKLRI